MRLQMTVTSALRHSPGKYDFHTCQDIVSGIRNQRARAGELEQLMARSSQGAGGEFVNAIAYRSEYVQTRGELAVLRQGRGRQAMRRRQQVLERARGVLS